MLTYRRRFPICTR